MSHISETPHGGATGGASGVVHAAKLNSSRDNNFRKESKRGGTRPERRNLRPFPGIKQKHFAPGGAVPGRGVREREEAYPALVRVGDLRVIECRDRLQWILQRRRKGGRWVELGYFRNRGVLIERSGLDCPELRSLPALHLGRQP